MKRFILLLLVLIIAIFLRTYHLSSLPPGLYPDEAMNGNNAAEALETGNFKIFYPENNGREGLFVNIQALFLGALKVHEPWVLRLPSAIFGILTVLGLYLLGRELFSPQIGLLSAFFLATSFWHINFSRIGFRAIMAPLLLTWALFLLIASLKGARNPEDRKKHLALSLLGGVLYGAGFYTYISYRVTPLLVLLIIFAFWPRGKDARTVRETYHALAHFVLATVFVALPLGVYFLNHPADFLGRTSELSVFSSPAPWKNLGLNIVKTIGMFNVRGDWNWRHNVTGEPELFPPIGVLFLIGFAFAVKCAFGKSNLFRFPSLFLLWWFALGTLPVVISNEGLPHALRAILTIPPVFLFAACGGAWLYETAKSIGRHPAQAFAIAFLIALPIAAYRAYFKVWGEKPNVSGAFSADYVEIGRKLNALPPTVPKYVVVEAKGVDVRGIPMPAQTVMFISDTFSPEQQRMKNVHYLLPGKQGAIPKNAFTFYVK